MSYPVHGQILFLLLSKNTGKAVASTGISIDIHFVLKSFMQQARSFNPIALRKAKIVCNFGLSECNRAKVTKTGIVERGLVFSRLRRY